MKKKKNLWLAPLLALLFVFGVTIQGAFANQFDAAPAPIISYGATVNVPNTTTGTGIALGNIVITSPATGDLVANSTITVEAPADTKFADAGTVANSGTVVVGAGALNASSTEVTYTVSAGSAAGDTVTISSLELIAQDPTKTSLNEDNLHLTITANGGTSAPTTGEFGTIRLVQVPDLTKAVLVSGTAIDLYFNTDVAAGTTDPFAANQLTTAGATFTISTAGVTASTLALDYNAATKPTGSKKLVHVTGLDATPSVADTVTLNAPSGNVINALTASGGTAVSQTGGTTVSIQPQDVEITSVNIVDADKTYGVVAFNSKNVINATVVANPGAIVTLRLKSSSGTTVNADNASGVVMATSDGTVTAASPDTLTIPASGTAHITLTLSSVAAFNAVAPTTKVTTGITLEASTSGFVNDSTAAADTITVDRKSPSVVLTSGKAIDNNTLEVTFTEPIAEAAGITTANYTLGGANSSATISYVELSADAKTVTLHTSLLSAGTTNTIAPTTTITDLVGNPALTTATNAFNTAGQALTSVSLLSIQGASATPATFVTKVKNGAVLNVRVEGPTALAALKVRAVDANDSTFVIGTATTAATFTEKSVGVYESNGGTTRITLAATIASSVTAIKLQASTDSFVTYVESDPIDVDNTAPKVASASAAGATGVKVVFTEPVSKTDAETATSYTISGSGVSNLTVSKAALQPDGKTVLLTTSAQTEGATYTVDIGAAIYDAADNAIVSTANALTIDRATFTGVASDTEAPIFSDPAVSADLTTVTITITDKPDANPSGVDLTNSQITGFYKDGVQVSGTATKTSPNILVFTPSEALEAGATYQITVRAQDYAGNQNLDTLSFSTASVMSISPSSLSVVTGATADATVSNGTSPYTVSSSNEGVATASVTDSTITITGVAAGTATVTITDSAANTVELAVTVADLAPTPVPTGQTVTKLTGDDIANAAVNLGSVATGGSQMQLAVNFPAYTAAVDEYVGLLLPDGSFFYLGSDNKLTTTPTAYAVGVTAATKATVFDSFDVCTPFGSSVPTGTWTVYSLVVPTNGGDISAIDFATGDYDLPYYSFNVTCP